MRKGERMYSGKTTRQKLEYEITPTPSRSKYEKTLRAAYGEKAMHSRCRIVWNSTKDTYLRRPGRDRIAHG